MINGVWTRHIQDMNLSNKFKEKIMRLKDGMKVKINNELLYKLNRHIIQNQHNDKVEERERL